MSKGSSWDEDGYRKDDPRASWNKEHNQVNKKYKNTKKWCKGKSGRLHDFETIKDDHVYANFTSKHGYDQCKICGKRMNFTFEWTRHESDS